MIQDFNYDGDGNPATDTSGHNNTLTLDIFAADLEAGIRGVTRGASLVFFDGRPTAATIELDSNADGSSWFFDSTPTDDAEFTAIVNSGSTSTGTAFQSSFVDAAQSGIYDFYTTVLHEIGHAAGILLGNARLTNFTTFAGFDQVSGHQLRQFHNSNGDFGVTATLTTAGGAHIYEGTAANPVHPNELMNSGRTLNFTGSNRPTVRRQISDLTVQILADAYGYGVTLPSTLDTAHVTLDSQTGTLLVQGRTGGLNDTITIDTVGDDIRVQVNGTTELVPIADVTQIILARKGGNDIVTINALAELVQEVDYVVSSNEDSADAGTLGDGLVDLDPVVPGNQVALRAAVRDANAAGSARSIYVPRGHYELTLTDLEGSNSFFSTINDLDVTGNVTIVGTGAGASVIDASGLTADGIGVSDRLFHVGMSSSASLHLSRLTLTGGHSVAAQNAGNGGAILVRDGASLELDQVALVGNTASWVGGAIFVSHAGTSLTVRDSVFTDNTAAYGGAIYMNPNTELTLGESVFANNTGTSDFANIQKNNATLTNEGNNLADDNDSSPMSPAVFDTAVNDYVGSVDYVVTSVADTFDGNSDPILMSLRDAIHLTNIVGSPYAEEIWIPAWQFILTRERTALPNEVELDVSQGDLEIDQTLTIRGVNNATKIAWWSGAAADAVFDLLGDYNGDGIASEDDDSVDSADYVIWRNTLGSTEDLRADGNDNGVVDQDDYSIWYSNFGNTLTVEGVTVS